MKVYFIRHGEKEGGSNHDLYDNIHEVSLTNRGTLQAELVSQFLNPLGINAIYSSEMLRAFQTASLCSKNFSPSLKIIKNASFNEKILSDKFIANKVEIESDFYRSFENWDYKRDDGESQNECVERFKEALDKLVVFHKNEESIAIFTHGRIMQSFFFRITGDTKYSSPSLVIKNCDIFRYNTESETIELIYRNSDNLVLPGKEEKSTALTKVSIDAEKVYKYSLLEDRQSINIEKTKKEYLDLILLKKLGFDVPDNISLKDDHIEMSYVEHQEKIAKKENLKLIGELLASIHKKFSSIEIDDKYAPNVQMNSFVPYNFYYFTTSWLKKENLTKLSNVRWMDSEKIQFFINSTKHLAKYINSNKKILDTQVLIYGDFKPANIIYNSGNFYLIDPLLTYGDAESDAAKFLASYILEANNSENLDQIINVFIEGYAAIKKNSIDPTKLKKEMAMYLLSLYSRLFLKNNVDSPDHQFEQNLVDRSKYILNNLMKKLIEDENAS